MDAEFAGRPPKPFQALARLAVRGQRADAAQDLRPVLGGKRKAPAIVPTSV